MSNLYDTISVLCHNSGMSVSGMAQNIGISKSALSELKSGRSKALSAKSMQKIADYFNVSVDYLLGNEEKQPDVLDQVDLAFYGEYKELDEQEKDVVREMVRQLRRRREEKGSK